MQDINQQLVNRLQNSTSKVQSYNYINAPSQSSSSMANQPSSTSIHNSYGQQQVGNMNTYTSINTGPVVNTTANTITHQPALRSSTMMSTGNNLQASMPLRSTMPPSQSLNLMAPTIGINREVP